ncbi:NAD(P)-binding protein [Cristinia sonorae]|uniref:NAD(P)-binding protein n=1 Tax=Cristinia sonorae TaxID=1940300 RepID=A0A8K0UVY2_9AGAR|nr:NAD(P)-binding protein [Cristinia sonorae]
MSLPRPIIVVTGANSGVGYGICRRFLQQFSQPTPPDAKPQFLPLTSDGRADTTFAKTESYEGLTLILACRNEGRANTARQQLLQELDEYIHGEKRRPGYDGYAERFRDNLEVNIHLIDMSSLRTVFRFARELSQKYPYISHLICNAGGAVFEGIDWLAALGQLIRHPIIGVTVTEFKIQQKGVVGPDGLGLVWQSNVFSHYVLSHLLEPLFAAYADRSGQPGRVLWTSSLEASPTTFNRGDLQCIKTDQAYEATKYQIDLLASELHRRTLEATKPSVIRHIIVHPGISHSDLTKALIGAALEYAKLAFFYVVRFFGSRNHTIEITTAAISATHLCLISLLFIPNMLTKFTHARFADRSRPPTLLEDSQYTHDLYRTGRRTMANCEAAEAKGKPSAIKFSAEADRLGNARVGVYSVIDYKEHEEDAKYLADMCEELYHTYQKLEGAGRLDQFSEFASVWGTEMTNGTTLSENDSRALEKPE